MGPFAQSLKEYNCAPKGSKVKRAAGKNLRDFEQGQSGGQEMLSKEAVLAIASNTSSTATDHVPTTLLAAFEEEDDHNTDGEADVQWIVPVDTAAATPSAKKAKRAAKGRGKTVHRVAPSTFQGKIYCARK